MLTEEQKQRYLYKKGVACPFCESGNIESMSDIEYELSPWQDCHCNDCYKNWRDFYSLTDVHELEADEDEEPDPREEAQEYHARQVEGANPDRGRE
jgi:hypothetical protein